MSASGWVVDLEEGRAAESITASSTFPEIRRSSQSPNRAKTVTRQASSAPMTSNAARTNKDRKISVSIEWPVSTRSKTCNIYSGEASIRILMSSETTIRNGKIDRNSPTGLSPALLIKGSPHLICCFHARTRRLQRWQIELPAWSQRQA
jgi:hypothetical protein